MSARWHPPTRSSHHELPIDSMIMVNFLGSHTKFSITIDNKKPRTTRNTTTSLYPLFPFSRKISRHICWSLATKCTQQSYVEWNGHELRVHNLGGKCCHASSIDLQHCVFMCAQLANFYQMIIHQLYRYPFRYSHLEFYLYHVFHICHYLFSWSLLSVL